MDGLRLLIRINFYFSVIVLIAGSLLSLSENHSIFEFNEELHGAMDNNLRLMMVYLAITETVVPGYCFLEKIFRF